jgi:methionyl aminopeptidase
MGLFSSSIEVKTPGQIDAMRRAGLVVADTLKTLRAAVRPGITTGELDSIAAETIRSAGATPSFLGYYDFPGVICASVNDEVVHGIPGSRVLVEGDMISLDCGAIVGGFHGDSAITVPVGEITAEEAELISVTEDAMWRGIAATRAGGRVGDVSHAIESYVRSAGRYGILRDYTGHGIGSEMHMDPDVPNVGRPGRGHRLEVGMAIAIEPMVTLGAGEVHELDDEWTAVTDDGSKAAHVEHTVAITSTGLWVTTALDGGRARLAELGVPFGGPADG